MGARHQNIEFVAPCYYIVNNLDASSVLIDIGTAHDADFSVNMIERFGLKSFGFDPTRKHARALLELEQRLGGRFTYFDLALSSEAGIRLFHEPQSHVSGSFFSDHIYASVDTMTPYPVRCLTLDGIFDMLHLDAVDVVKIDVEGMEYSVFNSISDDTIRKMDQIVVEFHHRTVDRFTPEDTKKIIQRIESLGYRTFTVDHENFLFYSI